MGWFKKKEPPGRKEAREEFRTVTARLKGADELRQVAVGHSINLAHKAFSVRFGSVASFKTLKTEDQLSYLKSLTDVEGKLLAADPQAALGFGLFKMWLGMLIANDDELATEFGETLAYLSKKGDLGI